MSDKLREGIYNFMQTAPYRALRGVNIDDGEKVKGYEEDITRIFPTELAEYLHKNINKKRKGIISDLEKIVNWLEKNSVETFICKLGLFKQIVDVADLLEFIEILQLKEAE